jgi:hypothetical protein
MLTLVLLMLRISPSQWRRSNAPALAVVLAAPTLFAVCVVAWHVATLGRAQPAGSGGQAGWMAWMALMFYIGLIAGLCGLLWSISLGVLLRSVSVALACAGGALFAVGLGVMNPVLGIVATLFWLALVGSLVCVRLADAEDRTGRCPACGYDLVGLVGDDCPECGVAIPEQSRWAALRRERKT